MTKERREQLLIDLKLAVNGGDNFTAQLMRLAMKADRINFYRLSQGFPEEMEIVEMWKNGDIPPFD